MAVRGSSRRKSAAAGAAPGNPADADAKEKPAGRRSRAAAQDEEQGSATQANEAAAPPVADSRSADATSQPEAAPPQGRTPPPEHVAVAAYYLAERRGFSGDQQVEDWLAAERALAAEFASTGDDDAAARGAVKEDIQPDEVEKWAEALHVTPERLRVAIQRVGPVSSEVRKFLQESQGR